VNASQELNGDSAVESPVWPELASIPAPVEAILLDLDGTLVDTMPLHFQAYRDVLAEVGIVIDFRTFMAASGGAARETIPRLLAGRSCAIEVAEIHRRKIERANKLFQETPPPALPSALLLPVLARHYPIGLVSSGSRKSVSTTVEVLGWSSLFKVLVTGDDVSHGKPDPEGYLRAAAALNVDPRQCLVFEDMDDGVAAAKAAGMTVFDVRDTTPAWRNRHGTETN
jgi:beta-phosphoglucomutase-like phosphatase (HAD superfamily)